MDEPSMRSRIESTIARAVDPNTILTSDEISRIAAAVIAEMYMPTEEMVLNGGYKSGMNMITREARIIFWEGMIERCLER